MFGHDSPFIKGSPQTQTLSNSAPLEFRPLNVLSLSFFRQLFQFLAFVSYNSGNSNEWGWMNKNSLDFALHSRLNINVTLLTVVAMKPWQNIISLKPTTCQWQNKIHNKEKSINQCEIRRTIKCDYFWRGVEFSADPVYSSDLGLFAFTYIFAKWMWYVWQLPSNSHTYQDKVLCSLPCRRRCTSSWWTFRSTTLKIGPPSGDLLDVAQQSLTLKTCHTQRWISFSRLF